MLDYRLIRKDPEGVASRLKKKHFDLDLAAFQSLSDANKKAEAGLQALLTERKQASKKIGELVQSGVSVDEAKKTVNETLAKIDEQEAALKERERSSKQAFESFLLGIPNLPDDEVPEGNDEDQNVEILCWGEPPALGFEAKDHVDLGNALSGFDFDTASKITGSRFSVMKGGLARLHRAITQFMLDTHVNEHGYEEVYVPYIVNSDSLTGTGQLPKFEEDLFKLEGEHNYYLIPTAEVPITNIVRDTIIEDKTMGEGISYVAHTPCFRSEAGSYGHDTRGLIRQHQFEKVEMVQMVRPADSVEALERLCQHAENILQKLGLAYRKVILCGGDLGFSSQRTYDLEVWLPGQQKYREISSCSNFGNYQARRMHARWRNPETGKPELLHTINGSGLAVGRTLVAVMENYQTEQGSIKIPDVLVPYVGGLSELSI